MTEPSYPQRWQDAVDAGRTVKVFVPAGAQLDPIAAGSGIVGIPDPAVEGMTIIDFEGNVHGAVNLRTWPQRVHAAAGRSITEYPTKARGIVLDFALIEVGVYRCATRDIAVTDLAALRRWLDGELVEVDAGGIVHVE